MRVAAIVTALALFVVGCGKKESAPPPPVVPSSVALAAAGFKTGETIPKRFTCDGDDVPPPLNWGDLPEDTKELAIVMEDPDAPNGPFVHWTIWGIAPQSKAFAGGKADVPQGAKEGKNSFGKQGYGGPCPPEGGDAHRYRFVLYALKKPLDGLKAGDEPAAVYAGIRDNAIARGLLEAKYGR